MCQLLCVWKQNYYSKCHTFPSCHINLITTEITYCTEHVRCSLSHHYTHYWWLKISVSCLQTWNWHVEPVNANWSVRVLWLRRTGFAVQTNRETVHTEQWGKLLIPLDSHLTFVFIFSLRLSLCLRTNEQETLHRLTLISWRLVLTLTITFLTVILTLNLT